MKYPVFLYVSVFALCFLGCKKESETKETDSKTSDNVATNSVKATRMWKAVVDDLRVREKPEMTAKVLTKVTYGTLMDDLNDKTTFETEVELQGVKVKAPWVKVRTKEGLEGWVHGAAVTSTEIFPSLYQTNPADTMKVVAFSRFLDKLSPNEPESVTKAMNEWKNATKGLPEGSADFALLKVRSFGMRVSEKSWEWKTLKEMAEKENKGLWEEKPYWHVNMNYNDYTRNLAKNGLVLDSEEGMNFVEVNPEFLLQNAGDGISAGMKAFLLLDEKEVKRRDSGDGGLAITAQEFAERTIGWELFNQKYPHFLAHIETENKARYGIRTLLYGMDNTPAFDSQTHKIVAEFKTAYEWVIKNHPQTQTGKAIQSVYDILKPNQFQSDKAHEDKRAAIVKERGDLDVL